MAEIGSDSYEKAMQQVKKGSEGETRGLEEQIQEAKKRELENQRLKDGIDLSRRIAGESARIQAGERATASQGLDFGFNTFMLTDRATPQMSVAPKDPSDTGTTLQRILKGKDTTSATPASGTEIGMAVPATRIETQNDPLNVVGSGNLTSTETIQAAQKSISSGNTSPENINNAMIKNIENGFAMLPKGLQDFFKGILNFIKGISGNQDANSAISKLLNNPEGKAILDRFAKSETGVDGKTGITFNEGAKITKSSKAKVLDGAPVDNPEPKSDKLDGRKITLDKDTKITSVKENTGTITIIAQNKDGSTDTYTISDTREQDKKTPPTSTTGTQFA